MLKAFSSQRQVIVNGQDCSPELNCVIFTFADSEALPLVWGVAINGLSGAKLDQRHKVVCWSLSGVNKWCGCPHLHYARKACRPCGLVALYPSTVLKLNPGSFWGYQCTISVTYPSFELLRHRFQFPFVGLPGVIVLSCYQYFTPRCCSRSLSVHQDDYR
jgi:hypothetical protein